MGNLSDEDGKMRTQLCGVGRKVRVENIRQLSISKLLLLKTMDILKPSMVFQF